MSFESGYLFVSRGVAAALSCALLLCSGCGGVDQSPSSPQGAALDTKGELSDSAGSRRADVSTAADASTTQDTSVGDDAAGSEQHDGSHEDVISDDANTNDVDTDAAAVDASFSDDAALDDTAKAPKSTIVVIHHPNGASLRLRGDTQPLSWSASVSATQTAAQSATFVLPANAGLLRVKATQLHQGKERWALGPNHVVKAGTTHHLYPYFEPSSGAPTRKDITTTGPDGKPRTVRLLLPPGYNENTTASYPLLVMFDGQNLFEDNTASFGVSWEIDEAVAKGVADGSLDEFITAGVDHGGSARIAEYTPWADPKYAGSGQGDKTLDWIEQTVLPQLDKSLRLLDGRLHKTLGGSSLGGLMSLYGLLSRPKGWSGALCLSGSWWWAGKKTLSWAPPKANAATPAQVWLDSGTAEGGLKDMWDLNAALTKATTNPQWQVKGQQFAGGTHSESSWKARVALPLKFRFNPGDREPAF